MARAGYTTEGSVRGRCPHVHRTLEGALGCVKRDGAGCARQGGYSDRVVVRVTQTGHTAALTRDEHEALARLGDDGGY